MSNENRKVKDSVFVDLFQECSDAKKNALSLYNALENTSLDNPDIIKNIKIDDTLYMNLKNDVSFMVENKLLVLVEHQSTVNENMPLRCLLYAGRLYEKIVKKEVRYRKKLVKVPTPEFIVLYNGTEEYPEHNTLKLSNAFAFDNENIVLELIVHVYNINSEINSDLLKRCNVLNQYTTFMECIRKYRNDEDGYNKAIKECIDNGVLKEYLIEKGSEVRNMLIAEYDYEMDMAVQREEAYEEAYEKAYEKVHEELSAEYEGKLQEKDKALQDKDAEIRRLKELVDAQKN